MELNLRQLYFQTKKLKKLWSRLQQVRVETEDAQTEHSRNRQELEATMTRLTRDLKLTSLVVENFVPPEFYRGLLNRAYFDEDSERWCVKPVDISVLSMGKLNFTCMGL